jgi:hypothetical protein
MLLQNQQNDMVEKKIYALRRAGLGPIVDADGNVLPQSEIPASRAFFVTTLNELKRAKAENREPIPLPCEPLTIEDMRKIVKEYDDKIMST